MPKNSPTLPEGVTVEQLKSNWDVATTEYAKAHARMKILDGADRGKIWEAVRAKFPTYQLTPDTNHVAKIKNSLLASLYSIGRQADLLPTSEEDVQTTAELNIAMEHLWATLDVPYYQMMAGERAALLNIGVTQIGWNPDKQGGTGASFYKGAPTLKNIDPMKYMRDPFSDDIDSASFAIVWDLYHKSVLTSDPNYAAPFKVIQSALALSESAPIEALTDRASGTRSGKKDYFRVEIHWVRTNDGDVHEIHTLNNTHVLFVKKNLKPCMIPVAELYCNLPAGDLVGTSEPSKIFANSLTYNIMSSILATSAYKNQRPPRFVTNQALMNLDSFVKYGNDSDYTFVVNGPANQAVHYQQFPAPGPETTYLAGSLANDIKDITGVTDKYTGSDTGSLLTTGGMEAMLDQATMIDQPKLNNYEKYSRRLTSILAYNMIEFGMKRKYYFRDKKTGLYKTVEVNPTIMTGDIVFNYQINISPMLPKNRARIAQQANVLMEKQLQYGQSGQGVQWITPEEWLQMQDLPMKEMMQERMGLERNADYIKKVSQIIFQYAELTSQGMDPEDALVATASTMEQQQTPQMQPGQNAQVDPNQIMQQLQMMR